MNIKFLMAASTYEMTFVNDKCDEYTFAPWKYTTIIILSMLLHSTECENDNNNNNIDNSNN